MTKKLMFCLILITLFSNLNSTPLLRRSFNKFTHISRLARGALSGENLSKSYDRLVDIGLVSGGVFGAAAGTVEEGPVFGTFGGAVVGSMAGGLFALTAPIAVPAIVYTLCCEKKNK